jgi:hypothetical protein
VFFGPFQEHHIWITGSRQLQLQKENTSMVTSRSSSPLLTLAYIQCAKVKKYNKAKHVSNFLICGAKNVVEDYGKIIKILHGCPFEGWPNRERPFHPFWQKELGWPCPVRSALKRTPMEDFNSFSIMFSYIISTTYQKIGDLFCPAHISGLSHSVYTANGPLFFKEDFSMLSHFRHQIYWESTITFKKNCFHSHIKIA